MEYTLDEARYRCLMYMPYLYKHICNLEFVPKPGIGTMAVDQWMRCYYDPAFLERITMDQATAVILHEDLHCIQRHCERASYLGATPTESDLNVWNVAADCTVNPDLRDTCKTERDGTVRHMQMPEGAAFPGDYGLPDNLSAEEYFIRLKDLLPEPPSCGGNYQMRGGSCADGKPRPWEDGPPEDAGAATMRRLLVERAVAEEIEEAARKDRGSVPGALLRRAQEILRPKRDPLALLRHAVRYAVSHGRGQGDYTFRRPSRRQPDGLRIPACIMPLPQVYVLVDTSGSMSQDELGVALGVVKNALASIPADNLRIMSGDTCAHTCQRVMDASRVQLVGGGGTDMKRMILDACDQRPRPDVLIVVTDGWTGWPETKVRPRTIIALTDEPKGYPTPSWAKTVVVR